MVSLVLNDYGAKNIDGFRYFLVVSDSFSKFGWTVPLKNKNARAIKAHLKTSLRLKTDHQFR